MPNGARATLYRRCTNNSGKRGGEGCTKVTQILTEIMEMLKAPVESKNIPKSEKTIEFEV